MKMQRARSALAIAVLAVVLLSACTPPDPISVRLAGDGRLVAGICRSMRVDVIRFLLAPPTGPGQAKDSEEIWLAEGSAFLDSGSEISFGQPPTGFETTFLNADVLEAEEYSEGTFVVSLEDYDSDGLLQDGLSMTFAVSALGDRWLGSDGSIRDSMCD